MTPLSGTLGFGKPRRALRILAQASKPYVEQDVYYDADSRCWNRPGTTWHAPLLKLVRLGYAARSGKPGGYEYVITEAGREAFAAQQTEARP